MLYELTNFMMIVVWSGGYFSEMRMFVCDLNRLMVRFIYTSLCLLYRRSLISLSSSQKKKITRIPRCGRELASSSIFCFLNLLHLLYASCSCARKAIDTEMPFVSGILFLWLFAFQLGFYVRVLLRCVLYAYTRVCGAGLQN